MSGRIDLQRDRGPQESRHRRQREQFPGHGTPLGHSIANLCFVVSSHECTACAMHDEPVNMRESAADERAAAHVPESRFRIA